MLNIERPVQHGVDGVVGVIHLALVELIHDAARRVSFRAADFQERDRLHRHNLVQCAHDHVPVLAEEQTTLHGAIFV